MLLHPSSMSALAVIVVYTRGIHRHNLQQLTDDLPWLFRLYSQESTAAGGYRQTNSELSRILDFLDEAAGDAPAAATLPLDAQGGRQW